MKVVTEFNQEMIKQHLEIEDELGFVDKQFEEIMFLKADHVRKVLIDLGWTPPKEEQ